MIVARKSRADKHARYRPSKKFVDDVLTREFRIALEVDDLAACINELKKQGLRFRNEMETGPGGKQIQLEDPDVNPVELFEPGPPPGPAPDRAK